MFDIEIREHVMFKISIRMSYEKNYFVKCIK